MTKDSIGIRLMRFFVGVAMFAGLVFYPIGKVLTDPTQINTLLDRTDIETYAVQIYTQILRDQISATSFDATYKEEILNQIDKNIISPTQLRVQRVEAINKLYEDLENGDLPEYTFQLENPIQAMYDQLTDIGKDFFSKIVNQEICTNIQIPGIGDTINGTTCFSIAGLFFDEKQQDTAIFEQTYTYTTNFGITEENLPTIRKVYLTLKYLAPFLMWSSLIGFAILIVIEILQEKDNWYKEPLKIYLTQMAWAILIWAILPLIIKIFEPFSSNAEGLVASLKLPTENPESFLIVQRYLNNLSYELVLQMRKFAIIPSAILTAVLLISALVYAGKKKIKDIEEEEMLGSTMTT